MNAQPLFRSDDQIIEETNAHNNQVLKSLREEEKEDTVKEAFEKMDSLLDQHDDLIKQLKELSNSMLRAK